METAANRSLIRLFPKFGASDNPDWGRVVAKARGGAPDALDAVGHHGDAQTHPVCKEVLAAISPGGTKGTDLHKRFGAPPFGWPRDSVNGAILTLLAAGNVLAKQDGKEFGGPKELPPTQIGKVTLYKEDEPPTATHRAAVRGLMVEAGIPYEAGQEGPQLPALLQRLKDLAGRAGGPPPLPEPPDTDHIDALVALGGNQRFRAVAEDHDRLREALTQWRAADQQRDKREAEWHDVLRLLRHAEELPVSAAVEPATAAIREGRQLLDDPDPITPLLQQLISALCAEVKQRADELAEAQGAAIDELAAWADWGQLGQADRDAIIADAKLVSAGLPDVSTDRKLLEVLNATPLSAWQDRVSLLPGRRDQARQRAAKQLEPESVAVFLPSATIKGAKDLEAYVAELRARVQPHLDAHKTVII